MKQPFFPDVVDPFPVDPVPDSILISGAMDQGPYDIQEEIVNRLQGRRWTEVDIDDWAMTGVTPEVLKVYIEPTGFAYYLPSLIKQSMDHPEYLPWCLEVLAPKLKRVHDKGPWWKAFVNSFTDAQVREIIRLLGIIKEKHSESIGPAAQGDLERARNYWGCLRGE